MKTREMNAGLDTGYQMDKAGRKKRKTKKRLFVFKIILAVILFSTLTVLLAISPLFNIKTVIVQGNRHYAGEELADSSGIIIGGNGFKQFGKDLRSIFSLRFRNAEAVILSGHPYIKDIRAGFSLPNKVKVVVTEREPFAVVPAVGTNLLVDAEGYVLESSENSDAGYPVIRGLSFKSFQLGQALKLDNPDGLATSSEVLKALERSDRNGSFKLAQLLGYIDVADMKRTFIQLDSRILVNLGDLQDLDYRVAFLKEILLKKLKKDDKGTLDFTSGESPEFIPDK